MLLKQEIIKLMGNRRSYTVVNIVCSLVLILFFCSCNFQKDKTKKLISLINKNIGQELIIPDSVEIYKPFSSYLLDSIDIAKSSFKIYTQINTSCGTCIEKINKWDSLAIEFQKLKVPIIIICTTNDRFEVLKYACEQNIIKKFSYPFFLDKKNQFLKKNNFMMKHKGLKTVLTDNSNNILLIGNPLMIKEVRGLYVAKIQEVQKNQH